MLVGRTMMKNRGKEKYVLTTKLLTDPTGKKMGKSEGNMVTLEDSPENMFGKVMSWPDSLIPLAFETCTRVSLSEINQINSNPRDLKMKLAFEIVKIYHGEKKSKEAQENFVNTFQKGKMPEVVEEVEGGEPLNKILLRIKISKSNSEVFRLLKAGAIMDMTDNKKISSLKIVIKGHVYRIGKHRFIQIK
jgi:tyrosyl-tRNA synthetase